MSKRDTEGFDCDVIIAGAGPVGLTLAIDLGRRGIGCVVLERNSGPTPWPKMDRTNARSMEMFRRIGLADRIRARGYPADNPMDVLLVRRLCDPPLAVLPFPSVAEARRRIAACRDGSLPLEPYQLVSQNDLEPLLREAADELPAVSLRDSSELLSLTQDENGVTAEVADAAGGGSHHVHGRYLIGCDGGRSTVRRALGIGLEGQGGLRELRQVVFGSRDLYAKIRAGKGRHYNFAEPNGSMIIAQGSRREFSLHTNLPADTDFVPVLRDLIGFDCEIEIRHLLTWRYNLLVAERYRLGRVLLAGDSAHLVIPTGGLGMNTGVGDAFDLSWKLAGTLAGWGGPGLLDAYEAERRPVAMFNRDAAGWAAEGVPLWRRYVTPEAVQDGPEQAALIEAFCTCHSRMHNMVGAEWAYSYAGSPLIADEPGNAPVWETSRYEPHARPGVRLPHMWLRDGRPIQDVAGDGYTLLDLGGAEGGSGAATLADAFAALGAPLGVLRLDDPDLRAVYGRRLLLLRPDLHIAWRGERMPDDPLALARRVTGHRS
ncbi:FAD-dependent monooxygenase [Marinibaculum pumilum]|uniref:FAD-dependent monooxygenase n=1 Tax=Marinibaculum pumilum TaxID=1766165 RepID=A0ABV7KZ07_9PROT